MIDAILRFLSSWRAGRDGHGCLRRRFPDRIADWTETRLDEREKRRDPRRRQHSECHERFCRGAGAPHGVCDYCGQEITCQQSQGVDPETLRRRRLWRCHVNDCGLSGEPRRLRQARAERTRTDWEHLTDPVHMESIDLRMGEQYPSHVRVALRAFRDSDSPFATVPGSDARTLQSAIQTLGLDEEMYAETRGNEAVLRRVEKVAAR